jgi:hypothetical protein
MKGFGCIPPIITHTHTHTHTHAHAHTYIYVGACDTDSCMATCRYPAMMEGLLAAVPVQITYGTHTHMCLRTHGCMHVYVCMCIYIRLYACICVHVYIHTDVCMYIAVPVQHTTAGSLLHNACVHVHCPCVHMDASMCVD